MPNLTKEQADSFTERLFAANGLEEVEAIVNEVRAIQNS